MTDTLAAPPRRSWRWLRWPLLAFAAGFLVALASYWVSARDTDLPTELTSLRPGLAPRTMRLPLSRPTWLSRARSLVDSTPGQWVAHETLAGALLARARLTGSYADMAEAKTWTDKAFELAGPGTGPWLVEADRALLVHDLPRAQQAIDTVRGFAVLDDGQKSRAHMFQGDVFFMRGDVKGSGKEYAEGMTLSRDLGLAFRVAERRNRIGFRTGAREFLAEKIGKARNPSRQTIAFALLRTGVIHLQHGEWEEARARFQDADTVFPGWWTVEAHLAQMRALDGDTRGAIADYTRIATSSGMPEVMDALAALLRSEGRIAESRIWAAKAGKAWTERLALVPTAAWHHAIDHELAFGDPRRALAWAQADWTARPFGETGVTLAIVLNRLGRPAEALKVLDKVDASGWFNARQFAVRTQSHELLGQDDEAEDAREKALRLDPLAFDPRNALIWFGHG